MSFTEATRTSVPFSVYTATRPSLNNKDHKSIIHSSTDKPFRKKSVAQCLVNYSNTHFALNYRCNVRQLKVQFSRNSALVEEKEQTSSQTQQSEKIV